MHGTPVIWCSGDLCVSYSEESDILARFIFFAQILICDIRRGFNSRMSHLKQYHYTSLLSVAVNVKCKLTGRENREIEKPANISDLTGNGNYLPQSSLDVHVHILNTDVK